MASGFIVRVYGNQDMYEEFKSKLESSDILIGRHDQVTWDFSETTDDDITVAIGDHALFKIPWSSKFPDAGGRLSFIATQVLDYLLRREDDARSIDLLKDI